MKHGFFNAVVTAYNSHLPLILSPDDLWLLISLNVGHFLGSDEKMAEKYRKTFVDHEGKMKLCVVVGSGQPTLKLFCNDKTTWKYYVNETRKLIAKNTKADVAGLLTEKFTTTGEVKLQIIDC